MNKSSKYAINGALILGLGNALINVLKQVNEKQVNNSIDWAEVFKSLAKGAFVGASAGFVVGSIRDEEMSKELAYAGSLSGVILNSLNKHSEDNTLLLKKAKRIQEIFYSHNKNFLCEYPVLSGSVIKGTAILGSDIDIQVKFNNYSIILNEMNYFIEDYFKNIFNDIQLVEIRKQEFSIGLFFNLRGEKKRIDIVPIREVNNKKGDVYLYSTINNGIKKTNNIRQLEVLTFTEKQKSIIKLIKGWKEENEIYIPSIYIELIVKKAFQEIIIPKKIDKALMIIFEYIAYNITTLRLIDPANTNNIISDTLTDNEKGTIQKYCNKMLDNIEKDKRNILDYFN